MKRLLIFALLLLPALAVQAQDMGDMVIRNATVYTVTNGTLENTDILVTDGKIARIGQNLNAPNGHTELDASGLHVMPGIIDAHSHQATDAVNEGTNPITPEVRIGDIINPFDLGVYRALAGGTTAAHIMHGSANVIGGQGETIKHRYGLTDAEALKVDGAPRTIKFALGENPTRVHGRGNNIQPRTRMGVEHVLRESFEKAIRYRDAWTAYEAERRTNPNAVPPEYSERYQTLVDILNGDIIIHSHSYRADEILMLMRVMKDFGVKRLVFQHANEAFKVAPELAAWGAGASVFADWWAYKFEVYYSTAYNAAILAKNGVVTSVNSDSGELIRHLNHEAAKTQKYGQLTDDEALAMVTINPALQLGVGDRMGSIEVGKDADFAIFDGHPLSIYAVNQYSIIDGMIYFDRANDPDDMRLMPAPSGAIETISLHHEQRDLCGHLTTDWLFGLSHDHGH